MRAPRVFVSKLVLGALVAALLAVVLPAAPAHAAYAGYVGDDYPSTYKYQSSVYAGDKWGFTQRQCVSFAAWRMARQKRPIANTQGWGSAWHWDNAAKALGKRVTTTPKVGAIAQWNANESSYYKNSYGTVTFKAGSYGHVGYVSYVYSDGSVLIEQYNANVKRGWSKMRMKAPRYIYVY